MRTERNRRLEQVVNGLPIVLADSGWASLTDQWQQRAVCSPFSRLYVVLEGQGEVRTAEGSIPLQKDHAYLVPHGLVFDYSCDEYLLKLYFHIHLPLPDGFDLFARTGRCLTLPLAPGAANRLAACYRGERLTDAYYVNGQLYGLVSRFIEAAGLADEPARTYSETLSRLFPIIQQQLSSTLTVRALATRLSLSESTLARRFKEETGMTLGHYLDQMLLQRAQQLLLTTGDPIGQIAEALGFCDQFYFSRYFKQHMQETPSAYRRRLKALA